MKKLILIITLIIVSISGNCQTELENLIFKKLNDYRVGKGLDTLTFNPIAYKIAKDKSNNEVIDPTINDSDRVREMLLAEGIDKGGSYVHNWFGKHNIKDGSLMSFESLSDQIINHFTKDIELEVNLILPILPERPERYYGAVASVESNNRYYITIVLYEK